MFHSGMKIATNHSKATPPGPPNKKVDDARAIPFIRTNKNTWGLAQEIDPSVPGGIPSLKNDSVPVISCIGTSRDGKSTFLNMVYPPLMNF